MSLSPVKRLILETIWVLDKPIKAADIARDTRLTFPTVMMHIIGLTRMGYLAQREKGLYIITEKGKKTLGFPEIDKEKAGEILAYLPLEKSFHFYTDIGKPLNIQAASLQDFYDKILKIDISSVEFHVNRGDFEAWFMALGDIELARKTLLIKEQKIFGEALRKKLYDFVKSRCDELAKIRKNEVASG
jgi:DNA-binding transcriptional ArsR family regulator